MNENMVNIKQPNSDLYWLPRFQTFVWPQRVKILRPFFTLLCRIYTLINAEWLIIINLPDQPSWLNHEIFAFHSAHRFNSAVSLETTDSLTHLLFPLKWSRFFFLFSFREEIGWFTIIIIKWQRWTWMRIWIQPIIITWSLNKMQEWRL